MVGEGFGMKKQERIQQIQKTPYLCMVNAIVNVGGFI